uniref:Uncharacterized protein n=1 Tax=CrAss-like virus sp. ctyM420 TaxID=2828014 RepID=A0A8S5TJ13_9CAUD|nr:MAG TPA: hypothetical protein [CrAss-like virus sp. ctyM420]
MLLLEQKIILNFAACFIVHKTMQVLKCFYESACL